jgi:hypothetical protein
MVPPRGGIDRVIDRLGQFSAELDLRSGAQFDMAQPHPFAPPYYLPA